LDWKKRQKSCVKRLNWGASYDKGLRKGKSGLLVSRRKKKENEKGNSLKLRGPEKKSERHPLSRLDVIKVYLHIAIELGGGGKGAKGNLLWRLKKKK